VQVTFTNSTEIKSGHAYALRAQHSNLTTGVQSTSMSNGAPIVQLPGANVTSQKWMLLKVNPDSYKIVNTNSGKVLEVGGYSKAEGAKIQQWDWTGSASQQWKIVPTNVGFFRLVNSLSGLSLTVPNSSTAVGTILQQYTYYGVSSQQWAFDEMSPLVAGVNYAILSRSSQKAIDVNGFSATDGANILQYTWYNTPKQRWTVNSFGGYQQIFSNFYTGKVIEVGGQSLTDGGGMNQRSWTGNNWQLWNLEVVDADAGGYWYKVINAGSNKVMTATNPENMASIQQYAYWGASSQQWRFTRSN
jgi:hypothetical protein